jgi:hypothetical protein
MDAGNMKSARIQFWNLNEGTPCFAGAQPIFNVLGNISAPETVERLTYSLNGGPMNPVFFNSSNKSLPRLTYKGDFNIDTIRREQLQENNRLIVEAHFHNGQRVKNIVNFPAFFSQKKNAGFKLDLRNARYPQEIAQIVDGNWRIAKDENGERCIEITREAAGYDRIILFTDGDLDENYRIHCRMCVGSWLKSMQTAGLVFKWNPHLQGDGTCLPTQWTTGLGYFYSGCSGLRLRYGVDVHFNSKGEKLGDYVLADARLSSWRFFLSRIAKNTSNIESAFSQMTLGKQYHFCLELTKDIYSLTVWRTGCKKPSPQVTVRNPPPLIRRGAAGIIGYFCTMRIYEFEVESV